MATTHSRATLVRPSIDAFRLRWIVKDIAMEAHIDTNDPGQRAIEVLEDVTDMNSVRVPYKSESGELHPIHASSVSLIPRKELTVTFPALWNVVDNAEIASDYSDDEDLPPRQFDEPECEIRAANGEFITIGEYINVMYPWLISLRERYIRDVPVPGDWFQDNVELWVKPSTLIGNLSLKAHEPPTNAEEYAPD